MDFLLQLLVLLPIPEGLDLCRGLSKAQTAAWGFSRRILDRKTHEGIAFGTVFGASIHLAAGHFTEACAQAERLLTLPTASSRFVLLAQGILVESLVRQNRLTEARMRFAEIQHMFVDFPDSAPQEAYLQAVLLEAAGHAKESERRFREAARLFPGI
jgi:hypothetical protein